VTTRVYPALLIKDNAAKDTGIGVVFPDLPGCVSQGDTPQHAAEMALEALALHIESMV
jgi:predicted RNase H-like HicB family nuclease